VDAVPGRHPFWPAAAVGVAAGALSGLFGVGGGILIVPGLVLLLGMPQRRAHATSLAAIVPIAVAGAAGYAIAGAVDWLSAALLTAGAAVGAVAGTHALHRIPERGLRIIFAAFLLAAAASLPFEVRAGEAAIELGPVRTLLVALGAVAGAMAGLLLASASQAVAKGTSLAVIIPTALVGTIRNVRRGDVDLRTAAVVGLTGVATSFLASVLAVRMDPVLSAVLFGALLVAMSARLLLAARGRPIPGDRPATPTRSWPGASRTRRRRRG
jgi:uncharacterized membrane protein YfcA